MYLAIYPFFKLLIGTTKPRKPISGMYFSGAVEEVWCDSKINAVSDKVFGTAGFTMGINAEYVCVKASGSFIKKSKSLIHCEAAATPLGAWNAFHQVSKAQIWRKNPDILVLVGLLGHLQYSP
jgi:NADPH:quinone reductase-like Zn-dependent oxidoreductase